MRKARLCPLRAAASVSPPRAGALWLQARRAPRQQGLDFSRSDRRVGYEIVLICVSAMTYDVEYLFICLFVICVSLYIFGEVSVQVVYPFLIKLFIFLLF